jgi:protein-tyrosine phosphatase
MSEFFDPSSPEPNIKKSICPNLPDLDLSISKNWIENSKKNDFNERNASYTGPTTESNWVIKPNLLVGAYPNVPRNIAETNKIQENILNEGITTFISLNSEYGKDITHPAYASDTENDIQLYRTNGIKKIAKDLSKEEPKFELFPIIDMNVATDDELLTFCENLKQKLCDGEKLYIHCTGGHGRTGTVVAILLYMLYKIEPRDAFNYIQFAHDQRTANIIGNSNYSSRITDDLDKGKFQIGQVPTPQTQDQRDQVERIVNLLNTKVSEGGKRKQKTNKKRRTNKKKKTQKKRKLYRK